MGGHRRRSCDSNDDDEHSHLSSEAGEGHRRCVHEGCLLEATASIQATEAVGDILKFVDHSAAHVAKQISIAGIRDAEQTERPLSDARRLDPGTGHGEAARRESRAQQRQQGSGIKLSLREGRPTRMTSRIPRTTPRTTPSQRWAAGSMSRQGVAAPQGPSLRRSRSRGRPP